jgi:5-deoxy-glucuronate isomerase
MPDLLLKNHAPDASGLVHRVTPASAGWTYVGFEVWRLQPGMGVEQATGEREHCLVLLGGRADVRVDGKSWPDIGGRESPFGEESPFSVYVPAGRRWSLEARTPVELGVCSAPGGGSFEPRLIGPDGVGRSRRGTGTNVRHVKDILPEGSAAHSLLVVEVITPSGHWSSYPPHKHDKDNLPEESLLEETYYHRLDPPQGFALQRVYNDDRSLDVTMAVEDGDVVLVPEGYHPCGAAHGYNLYYLNVMAGPHRVWRFNTEAAHRWLLQA